MTTLLIRNWSAPCIQSNWN